MLPADKPLLYCPKRDRREVFLLVHVSVWARTPDTASSMYTRLSAPRTPVSFFREIRLMSYFDSNIILTFTHTAPEKQSTYTRYRYPLLPADGTRALEVRMEVRRSGELPAVSPTHSAHIRSGNTTERPNVLHTIG